MQHVVWNIYGGWIFKARNMLFTLKIFMLQVFKVFQDATSKSRLSLLQQKIWNNEDEARFLNYATLYDYIEIEREFNLLKCIEISCQIQMKVFLLKNGIWNFNARFYTMYEL